MADENKQATPAPVVIRRGATSPPEEAAGAAPAEPQVPTGSQPAAPAGAAAAGPATPGEQRPGSQTVDTPKARPPARAPRAGEHHEDRRPLWQRVAEERASTARGQARAGPGPAGRAPGWRLPRHERGPDRRPPPAPAAARPAPPRPPDPPPVPEQAAPDEGTFADMLAGVEAGPARRRFQVGEKVAGKIIQLGPDVAFLELGSGVAEAMIETAELAGADGQVAARVGDIIDAVVVHAGDRGVVVSKGHGQKSRDHGREALVEAARTGLPVEGLVKAVNKGGLEVEVQGVRAFCPVSQIDVRFVGDPASFVGQKLQFKVQRADARDAVLSRRALLEEERAERARATRERLAPGAVLEGVVTSVQDYGAFVDLGGIEGLVHVSELAWDRVSRPQDLLKAGDQLRVSVLRIEEDPKKGERISLSVKALLPRPEAPPDAPARPAPPPPPKVGDLLEASVDRVEPFGVFVRFAGGRGLVPAAETGTPRGADLRKAFKQGAPMRVMVSAIDEQGRYRLSAAEAERAAERAEAEGYLRAAPRPAGKGFGTLGDLLRAKLEKK